VGVESWKLRTRSAGSNLTNGGGIDRDGIGWLDPDGVWRLQDAEELQRKLVGEHETVADGRRSSIGRSALPR
jgi:hypothetical protein